MKYIIIFYKNNTEYKQYVTDNENKCWNFIEKTIDSIKRKYSEDFEVLQSLEGSRYGKYLMYDEKHNIAETFHYYLFEDVEMLDADKHKVYVDDYLIEKRFIELAKYSDNPINEIAAHLFVLHDGCSVLKPGLYIRSVYHNSFSDFRHPVADINYPDADTLKRYVRFNMDAFDEYIHSDKKINFNKLILKEKYNYYGK